MKNGAQGVKQRSTAVSGDLDFIARNVFSLFFMPRIGLNEIHSHISQPQIFSVRPPNR